MDDRKPLIAFVLPSMGLGGAELVAAALGSEFLRRGFQTDFVVGWDEDGSSAVVPKGAGYAPLCVTGPWGMLLPLARYLRERRPRGVIASLWPLTVVAIAAGKLAGSKAPTAVWSHSAATVQYRRLPSAKRLLFRRSLSLVYPFADARIAVSAGVADDLSALCGLPREGIAVIHNPSPQRPANPADAASAEAVWGGWSGPRILTVGNLRPEKNHPLLLRAFKTLLATRDARLLILGGDPGGNPRGLEEIKAHARSLGVGDKVIVPGRVPNPTAYYRSASVFVLSSDTEGLPTVLVEALGCGLPVVSTDCPYGPAEILAGGRYGWLTPVGDEDALARAIGEALDAPRDGDLLRRRAADFSPANAADAFLRLLFPQLVEQPRAAMEF